MNKGWLAVLVMVVMAVGAFLYFDQSKGSKNNSDNTSLVIMPEHKTLPDFSFERAQEQHFNNADLMGHWTLFFIGYTFCPDICPTTLADLDRIYPALVAKPYDNIQIVFVSVDPNRDKANNLAEYVNYFNANFIGVTSTHDVLFPFSKDLGLVYSIVEEGDNDGKYYLVDHSASLVLINPQGEHHATFKAVINENGIAHVDMDLMMNDIHNIMQTAK